MTEIKIHKAGSGSGGGGSGSTQMLRRVWTWDAATVLGDIDMAMSSFLNSSVDVHLLGDIATVFGYYPEAFPQTKTLYIVANPTADGTATTHSGSASSAGINFGPTFTGDLAGLDISVGDTLTWRLQVAYETVYYPAADAGGSIYPGVEYNQTADWRGDSIRCWFGDNDWYWTPGMQQLQYSEYFSTTLWYGYPAIMEYSMPVSADMISSDSVQPTFFCYKLWAENKYTIHFPQLELIVMKGSV